MAEISQALDRLGFGYLSQPALKIVADRLDAATPRPDRPDRAVADPRGPSGSAARAFRAEVCQAWIHTLRRRSQRSRHLGTLQSPGRAPGRALHPKSPLLSSPPEPALHIASSPEAGAVCGNPARTDLSGGRRVTRVPTATQAQGPRSAAA